MYKPLLIISSIILFLVSLDIRPPTFPNLANYSDLWNFWDGIFVIFVIFWYAHNLIFPKNHLNSSSIKLCLILTAALSVPLLFITADQQNGFEYLRLLTIIWTIPIIISIFKQYSSQLTLTAIIIFICLQSIWGIAQFSWQSDLNLNLIGESVLQNSLLGVAKFQLPTNYSYNKTSDPIKFIRAYGPYPHANTYGGALAIAFILLISLHIKNPNTSLSYLPLAFILILGILLSFSRSAWISLALCLLLLIFHSHRGETIPLVKPLLIVLLSSTIVFLPLIHARLFDPADTAFSQRIDNTSFALSVIANDFNLTGSGIGSYPKNLDRYLSAQLIPYQPWHITPVHNTPLLLAVEWGTVSAAIVALLILYLISTVYQSSWPLLLPLLPLLLFDHYLLTQSAPLLLLLSLLTTLAHPSPRLPTAH